MENSSKLMNVIDSFYKGTRYIRAAAKGSVFAVVMGLGIWRIGHLPPSCDDTPSSKPCQAAEASLSDDSLVDLEIFLALAGGTAGVLVCGTVDVAKAGAREFEKREVNGRPSSHQPLTERRIDQLLARHANGAPQSSMFDSNHGAVHSPYMSDRRASSGISSVKSSGEVHRRY
ncbi:MAG TPA: hypothetical protein PKB15_00450 [Acidimicrobiia bacterium]|nr:hypothetical protein [Acidimicrobiia bacterium]